VLCNDIHPESLRNPLRTPPLRHNRSIEQTMGRMQVSDPVAITALSLSGLLAAWEFAKRGLDSARVRVQLHAGLYEPHTLSKSSKSWSNLADMTRDVGGWPIEVAIIEIENPGRTAVTVSDISLDFGRVSHRPWWWRRTTSPAFLSGHGATTTATVRMEPFERATFITDVWQVLQPVNHHSISPPTRPFNVRASVRVAGRRGRTLSPWRKRWAVEVNQVSFLGPTVEPGLAMHRAAMRWIGEHDDIAHPLNVQMSLEYGAGFPLSGPAPTEQQVQTLIEKHTHGTEVPGAKFIWSFNIARDLAYHYSRPDAPLAQIEDRSPQDQQGESG
jgi:hypothetical protein